jgi:surface antigen
MSSLPESTAINSQAESQAVDLARAAATDTVVSKPQIVTTELKSKADIQAYTTVSGDTVSGLAQRFGVTSDSIRWSNNLTGDAITVGTKLTIPPVNGIVYTVQAGDSVDSLASKYNASKDKIIAFNDAEISGLKPGSQIVIPDGTKAVPMTASQIARGSSSVGFPWGGSAIYGYNGYDYGYCTWYVANRISVPSNWGNANTWDNLAPRSGWSVSSVPRAGAIGEIDSGYYGHVAYVEAVSDDGTMIKYSDMNGLAGFGRVGYSGWVPASKFPHYIYR